MLSLLDFSFFEFYISLISQGSSFLQHVLLSFLVGQTLNCFFDFFICFSIIFIFFTAFRILFMNTIDFQALFSILFIDVFANNFKWIVYLFFCWNELSQIFVNNSQLITNFPFLFLVLLYLLFFSIWTNLLFIFFQLFFSIEVIFLGCFWIISNK